MGAWRMCHHHIETIIENVSDVTLIMGTGDFCRQQVTGYDVMTGSDECVTNSAGIFASDEDTHDGVSFSRE
jgi:hypothetical protein